MSAKDSSKNPHHEALCATQIECHPPCHSTPLGCLLSQHALLRAHLADVHAGVAAEGPDGGEVVGTQQGGDDAVLVDLPDHGGVHEVHESILIHRNS